MFNSRIIPLSVSISMISFLTGCNNFQRQEVLPPNVVIILTDDMGYGDIFTMSGNEIKTIRRGDWKLFVTRPKFYQPVDLENWVDWRGPDGVTIIAPEEQATPADYPGVKPEHMGGELFLFNVNDDISEMKNRADDNPEKVEELLRAYNEFLNSL